MGVLYVLFFPFQLVEADQELYQNFPLVVSERWQQEVAETVFDAVNADTDKLEQKRKQKPKIDELDNGLYSITCYFFGNNVALKSFW